MGRGGSGGVGEWGVGEWGSGEWGTEQVFLENPTDNQPNLRTDGKMAALGILRGRR